MSNLFLFILSYYIFHLVIEMEKLELKDLVLENQNLIYSIASKFRGDIEDLFQVGTIGFIKAYKNFKKSYF